MQQEHGQQGALFGAAEREGPLLRDDLEWTEYPKFQQSGRPTPLADPTTARPMRKRRQLAGDLPASNRIQTPVYRCRGGLAPIRSQRAIGEQEVLEK